MEKHKNEAIKVLVDKFPRKKEEEILLSSSHRENFLSDNFPPTPLFPSIRHDVKTVFTPR